MRGATSNQQSLQHARDELEKRVDDRTVELVRANDSLLEEIAERRRVEQRLEAASHGAVGPGRHDVGHVRHVGHDPFEQDRSAAEPEVGKGVEYGQAAPGHGAPCSLKRGR